MSDKQCNKLLSAVAFLLGLLTLLLNANAQSHTANKISPSNNYSDSKLDFTLPFHLIDGYIFIDGQVNGKKGKFMFDTGTPFAFFLNLKLADQIQFDGLKSMPHSNFYFIQNNVVDKFLGVCRYG
jgi:hypothetical protein